MSRARRRTLAAILIASCILGLGQSAAAADRADKRELVKQARAAYYSLRLQGLDSFQATVTPDWESMLGPADPSAPNRDTAMQLLNGLHFAVSLDAQGKVVVTHRVDIPAPNETVQQGFTQIVDGMDLMIPGFFNTWSPFMLTSVFPEIESEYQLDDTENGYRLSYNEGTARVTTRLTRTFAIIELTVNADAFDSVITPTFATTEQGYVLAGYVGEYTPKSGPGVTRLVAQVESQAVEGFRLPARLAFDAIVDGVRNKTEVAFSNYTIKRR